jgi:D-psicose/D-tagatose/L-ribulose 3-epimerase
MYLSHSTPREYLTNYTSWPMVNPVDRQYTRLPNAKQQINTRPGEFTACHTVWLLRQHDCALSGSNRRRDHRSGIRCEACNNFFPPQIRLTGQDADLTEALNYAGKALDRAARLGACIVVFGSSASRNVPHGFPMEKAWQQLVELLGNLGPMAKPHGITITIEPLNKLESNIINLAPEGLRLAQEVDHPNIQLLLDFYHLMMERETPETILQAGSFIRHVHLAKPEGRLFPTEPEDELCRFFSYLERIRYSRRCSIEAYTSGFEADARRSLRILKEMTERPPAWLH